MARKTVYGRAYPITQKDAKAYRRAERSLKANPIGVTAMSSVNGRGSFKSARAVAQGKTRSQRLAHAKSVYRNGAKMAGILKNKRRASTKRKSSSKRSKVAGTSYYKTSGGRYQTAKGKFVSESRVKAARKRKRPAASTTKKRTSRTKTTKRAAPKRASAKRTTARKTRRVRRNRSVGYSASYSAGYDKMKRSEAAKKAARTRKRRAKATTEAPTKRRTAKRRTTKRKTSAKSKVGKYRRVKLTNPRTGRQQLSWMYRTSSGSLRKIPASAISRSGKKSAASIKKGRTKAAKRIRKEGSAFVANKSTKTKSAKQRRAGRRLAAYMSAVRSGKSKSKAKAYALRKVPLKRGDSFKGTAKAPVTTPTGRRTKVRRNKSRKRTLKANGTKRRKTTKRRSTAKRRTTKRTAAKRRTKRAAPKRRRSTSKRRAPAKRRVRRNRTRTKMVRYKRAKGGKQSLKRNRRSASKRRMRRNGSVRRYRKNAFMANLKAAFSTGLFVTAGYLSHRVLTNVLCNMALANTMPDNPTFQEWKKPLCGLGVLAIGVPLVGAAAPKRAIEVGAGMVASLLQSVIVSAFNSAGQPNIGAQLGGYSNSRAYALRGNRRRRRGFGQLERHATSIMPRYAPVGTWHQAAAGQYQQAAAGQFQQAAAGEYFTAGTGEYFTSNAVGEYFATPAVKGVGAYEPAGQLAMQASAGTNQMIRDGLRPDSDLDHALDVAEAAAGLGDATLQRVPRSSTWIPGSTDAPLWAGERPVRAGMNTSELPAGILARPGGNGILSAG